MTDLLLVLIHARSQIIERGRSARPDRARPYNAPKMIREAEAIPYTPELLRGERLLVLAPHPDDEVIGCGGLVAQHLRERRAVRVVVTTDGAEAEAVPDRDAYREVREDESRAGLSLLGDGAAVEIEFLRLRDRALGDQIEPLQLSLAITLRRFRPDLIAVPSPIEIHPDHSALARAFCELVQRDETLFSELATSRVAFYEVGQPIRPNALVDITDVAEVKAAAIAAHASQSAIRDYGAFARGLNAYRAMTLPPEVRAAEAYYVMPLPELRTTPMSSLQKTIGDARLIETTSETLPISVIVRTKDRPRLLREALASIKKTGYPCEVVVVNDGGAKPLLLDEKLIEHETSRGRSEAMNSGVRAATSKFVAFLDDDDLYYPEHLATLANAAATPAAGWYSDALSTFTLRSRNSLTPRMTKLRLFAQDFDRDLLLLDNYIPLPTLLVEREAFLDAGGFDPAFDLFEDWDFLIRLSQRGPLLRVPRITCEIRQFEDSDSITRENPEGSGLFREAKLQLWRKHAALIDNDVIANAFELQKGRANATYNELVETNGVRAHLQGDVERMDREKRALGHELTRLQNMVNELTMRIAESEGAFHAVNGALAETRSELDARAIEITNLRVRNTQLESVSAQTEEATRALYNEIRRQQSVLDAIFASKTWKLHTMVEKMKGRS
jgi:LmbE family N-acetylglucosaminyl deacetylase/glycosyltransferase involved in cell wall biosynthesis